jgi:hypothetical protein
MIDEKMFEGLTRDQAEELAGRIRTAITDNALNPEKMPAAIQQARAAWQREQGINQAGQPADWSDIEARGNRLHREYELLARDPIGNWQALEGIQKELAGLEGEIQRGQRVDRLNQAREHTEELASLAAEIGALSDRYEQLARNPGAHWEKMEALQKELETKQARIEEIRTPGEES